MGTGDVGAEARTAKPYLIPSLELVLAGGGGIAMLAGSHPLDRHPLSAPRPPFWWGW